MPVRIVSSIPYDEAQITAWNVQADDAFADLLEALAAALGYPFDRVQLKRGIYYPRPTATPR